MRVLNPYVIRSPFFPDHKEYFLFPGVRVEMDDPTEFDAACAAIEEAGAVVTRPDAGPLWQVLSDGGEGYSVEGRFPDLGEPRRIKASVLHDMALTCGTTVCGVPSELLMEPAQ